MKIVMSNESGCSAMRYAFIIVLAVLALVVWMIVRFTGQGHVTITDKT
jgi:hypothetical protein